jgi:hypothetical protein
MENNNITEDQRRNEATQFSILQKKKKKIQRIFVTFMYVTIYVETMEFHWLHSDMWHCTLYTVLYTNELLKGGCK